MLPNRAIDRYKSVQVKTASPGELLVMLYDGVFRFLTEAMVAMENNDRARSGERLDRAYAILSELVSTLKPEVWPELCENLEAVYLFCMSHIVKANLEQNPDLVKEIMKVLSPLREAWKQAIHQVATGAADTAEPGPAKAEPNAK